MRIIIMSLLTGAVIFVSAGLFYSGAFKPVQISLESRPTFSILYKEHTGAYHKITEEIEEVERWAHENNINCDSTFGEFFDNPQEVEQERLRSRGGCILANPLPENVMTQFKSEMITERMYVIAQFEGSPRIGPLKVYPKAMDYIQEHQQKLSGGVIEVYKIKADLKSMTTLYLFPISAN